MSSFEHYLQLISEKKIQRPLLILIGGYAGTGKSTLAKKVAELLPGLNTIPTGFIRAACKPFIKNEYSGIHTYDLESMAPRLGISAEALYHAQGRTLYPSILSIANFLVTERQGAIIEGNHIFPDILDDLKDYDPIIIFMKCSEPEQLIKNMTGETHPRELSQFQRQNAIKLNKFYQEEVEKNNLPVFEYNQTDSALNFVESELAKKLELLTK